MLVEAQGADALQPFGRNRLLAAMPREDRTALGELLEHVSLKPQDKLISAHETIAYAYLPLSGLVSVVTDADDAPIEVGLIGREGVIGLPAILGSDTAPHNYVVHAAGEALRVGMPALLDILRERPTLFRPFGLFAHVFTTQVGQTSCANANLTIPGRLARWLLMALDRLDGEEVVFTHEFLAVMLGVRRPGVTDALHVLEGTGAIRATRGHIKIRDRDKLVDRASVSYGAAEAEYERLFPAA